jgi:elongator complex protein 3
MRVMREIPPEYLVAGIINIDLRKDIETEFRKKNSKLKEIRYREIGFALRRKEVNLDLKLKITKYKSSGGKEYFLEIVNKNDILFGLLRLRLFDNSAIIRELHVYGQALKLGEKGKISQHKGMGKWLMGEAEKIVKKNKIKKLAVISGVGVREYYKKMGYKLNNTYMVKNI